MGTETKQQPALFHVENQQDMVFTPEWLAKDIIQYFKPRGRCLDPCMGDGAFFKNLPAGSNWCEIAKGRDFFAYNQHHDWIISNPPYSVLLEWIRHSMKVADNIVYLVQLYRVWSSQAFLEDVRRWGTIEHTYMVGTGTSIGWTFGHAVGAVYFKRHPQTLVEALRNTWQRIQRGPVGEKDGE